MRTEGLKRVRVSWSIFRRVGFVSFTDEKERSFNGVGSNFENSEKGVRFE